MTHLRWLSPILISLFVFSLNAQDASIINSEGLPAMSSQNEGALRGPLVSHQIALGFARMLRVDASQNYQHYKRISLSALVGRQLVVNEQILRFIEYGTTPSHTTIEQLSAETIAIETNLRLRSQSSVLAAWETYGVEAKPNMQSDYSRNSFVQLRLSLAATVDSVVSQMENIQRLNSIHTRTKSFDDYRSLFLAKQKLRQRLSRQLDIESAIQAGTVFVHEPAVTTYIQSKIAAGESRFSKLVAVRAGAGICRTLIVR